MTTLLDMVKVYLSEAEVSASKTLRLLEIAKRGLLDLHMDVSGLPETTKLHIDRRTLTAALPEDYITYKVLGYCWNGVIVPFAENPRIKKYPANGQCMPNNPNRFQDNINALAGFETNYVGYPYWGTYGLSTLAPNGLYGGFSNIGGDAAYVCYFTIDELNGVIQFGCNPTVEIVMEYLATPKKIKGSYLVHPFDQPALLAWIAWREIENKDVSEAKKKRKKFDYYRERGQSRRRHYGNTVAKAYQQIRQTNTASPKF